MKYLAVWCSLSGVASVVVGAKRTEESYFKNKLDTGHSRGLLDMGGDTKMEQRWSPITFQQHGSPNYDTFIITFTRYHAYQQHQ